MDVGAGIGIGLCIGVVMFLLFANYATSPKSRGDDEACKRIWKENEKVSIGDIGWYSDIRYISGSYVDTLDECKIIDILADGKFLISRSSWDDKDVKIIKNYRFLKKRTEEEQFDMTVQMPKENTIYEDVKTIEGGK